MASILAVGTPMICRYLVESAADCTCEVAVVVSTTSDATKDRRQRSLRVFSAGGLFQATLRRDVIDHVTQLAANKPYNSVGVALDELLQLCWTDESGAVSHAVMSVRRNSRVQPQFCRYKHQL